MIHIAVSSVQTGRLIRVFSARDYEAREGHGNDGAVLLITKGKPRRKEDPKQLDDLLVVRPQVLRSVKKQRAEARRRAMESGEAQSSDPGELEFTRRLSNSSRGSQESQGSRGSRGVRIGGRRPSRTGGDSPRRGPCAMCTDGDDVENWTQLK
ncbi:unnamed protein product [Cladocopium goreaui]|uniref:Uncharacterized protein n=1 Tax=Cladocopium goreaui TaxID=2562237 RepID=A0A9P1CBJ8_9DINO|nr:unnamed protein product [Cladocopium goreaui]